MRADLHVHTYYSDGLLSPDEVAALAANGGVEIISITDHDNMCAYPEIIASCNKYKIKVAYGIEVSAYYNGVRLHILGYGINPKHPQFSVYCRELKEGSFTRTEDILHKLKGEGISLTWDDLKKYRKSDEAPVHAMHIARACVDKGYGEKPFSFYSQYLAKGNVAYSELCRPAPEQAVEKIFACGGFPVLAHPGRIELEKEELITLIKKLVRCGLQGIEASYSTHTQLQTGYYIGLAREHGLLVTSGSDVHFNGGSKQIGVPVFDCGEELCKKLKV